MAQVPASGGLFFFSFWCDMETDLPQQKKKSGNNLIQG